MDNLTLYLLTVLLVFVFLYIISQKIYDKLNYLVERVSLLSLKIDKINNLNKNILLINEDLDKLAQKVEKAYRNNDSGLKMDEFLNNVDIKYSYLMDVAKKKQYDKWENLRKAFNGKDTDV